VAALLSGGALVLAGLAVAPAYADEEIDGPLESGDTLFPNQGNGGYDVIHYDVDIAWTPVAPLPQSTIDATTTIEATTTGDALDSFGLDLEGLTVTSVTVDGDPAVFSRLEGDPNGTEPPPKRKLVVTPADPVTGPFTVVVDYEGVPTTHFDNDGSIGGWIKTADGALFLGQPTGSMTGFPNNNTPKDKATYTFTIDVPETLEVASNGELVSSAIAAGRRTWVWDQEEPMASELSLITIGQYDVLESDVSLSGGRTIHEWSFVDSNLSPSVKANINSMRAQLSAVLTGLEGLFGPYPGNSTGVVVDIANTGYALETQDRAFFPGNIGQTTFVHELVHQWYGDAVAPADWNGLWVNEGMATWAPTRVSGNTETTYFNTWNNTSSGSGLWTVPPSGMTSTEELYGWQSYTRGAMTYEALRAAIGDPAFFQLIKQWQTAYSGQTRHWNDLITMAEQISGRDLDAFFQDWIYDANKPAWPGKLSLAMSASPGPGTAAQGSTLTYQLSATNTGKVPLTGAVVSVDLANVLDDATIGALPAGVSLVGTTLTWTVPTTSLSATATTAFPVTVRPDATLGSPLTATGTISTLGGTCATCTVTHTVGPPTPPAAPSTFGAECQVKITGKARVGRKLGAVLKGCPVGTVITSHQWFANGKQIKRADGATYKLKRSKLGKKITVRATVSAPAYVDAQRVSPPTKRVRR
jgi:hypothetical protein